jgi:type II secretory pathway component GspD/PulD (secretin)
MGTGRADLMLVFKKHKGGAVIRGGTGVIGGSGFMGAGGIGGPDLPAMPGMMGGGGGRSGTGGGAEIEVRTIRLTSTQAPEVAAQLEKAFPKARSFHVVAEPVSNTILVTADPATMKKIHEMIESLDVKGTAGANVRSRPAAGGSMGGASARPTPPGSAGGGAARPAPGGIPGGMGSASGPMGRFPGSAPARGELRIIALRHADAQELSTVVGRVFPNADVTAEPRSNQLIIRTDDKTMNEMEALIGRLDVDVGKR